MSGPGPSEPVAGMRGAVAREPATACSVERLAVEENMANETPWARFYRQQAGEAFSSTVGRLLDSWKTRRTLGDRDVADGDARSLRR